MPLSLSLSLRVDTVLILRCKSSKRSLRSKKSSSFILETEEEEQVILLLLFLFKNVGVDTE